MGKPTIKGTFPFFRKKKHQTIDSQEFLKKLPGPHPLRYIGNLHQISNPIHVAFNQMAGKYGPVFEIRIGLQLYTIVNDDQIVNDLVIRGGVIYSSRLSHNNPKEISLQYNDLAPDRTYWRTMRSLTNKAITGYIVNTYYQNIIHREVKHFMYRLLKTSSRPIEPTYDLRICVLNTLASITYGSRSELTVPTFKRFYNSLAESYAMDVNSKLNSVFSWASKTLPVGKHKPYDIKARKRLDEMANELIMDLRQRVTVAKGRQHCFAAHILKAIKNQKQISERFTLLPPIRESIEENRFQYNDYQTFDEYDSLHLIALFLFGGTGATVSQQRWIFAQLSFLPTVQYKIQRELYKLIGQGQFPNPKDYVKLPYLRAVIKECIRFRPLGFLTVPHAITVNNVYRGYHIPGKSTILVNTYPTHFSPALFDRPNRFIPERFLDENGNLLESDDWKNPWIWSKGPQACIGQELSERLLCTIVCYTLTFFTIEREIDIKTGNYVELNMTGDPHGLDLDAPNHKLKFIPRSGINADKILSRNY
ncbi:hypothetical protein G9A89_001039 [Geosiphon pyriformis]|nr:hypothetical protein G9A89_001039 [Geosiphon pyriformis]